MERPQFTKEDIEKVLDSVKSRIFERLEQKGYGIFVSSHEILGVVSEEFDEFKETVHDNDSNKQWLELMDIVVGAIVGMTSINSEKMDWM